MSENWNRCDLCGEFISFEDFEKGEASRVLISPDSIYTEETWETYHKACVDIADLIAPGKW